MQSATFAVAPPISRMTQHVLHVQEQAPAARTSTTTRIAALAVLHREVMIEISFTAICLFTMAATMPAHLPFNGLVRSPRVTCRISVRELLAFASGWHDGRTLPSLHRNTRRSIALLRALLSQTRRTRRRKESAPVRPAGIIHNARGELSRQRQCHFDMSCLPGTRVSKASLESSLVRPGSALGAGKVQANGPAPVMESQTPLNIFRRALHRVAKRQGRIVGVADYAPEVSTYQAQGA